MQVNLRYDNAITVWEFQGCQEFRKDYRVQHSTAYNLFGLKLAVTFLCPLLYAINNHAFVYTGRADTLIDKPVGDVVRSLMSDDDRRLESNTKFSGRAFPELSSFEIFPAILDLVQPEVAPFDPFCICALQSAYVVVVGVYTSSAAMHDEISSTSSPVHGA